MAGLNLGSMGMFSEVRAELWRKAVRIEHTSGFTAAERF